MPPDTERQWATVCGVQKDLRFAFACDRAFDVEGFSYAQNLGWRCWVSGFTQEIADECCKRGVRGLLRIGGGEADFSRTSRNGSGKDDDFGFHQLWPFAAGVRRHVNDISDSWRKSPKTPNHSHGIGRDKVTPLGGGHISGEFALQLLRLADANLGDDRGREGKVGHVSIGQQGWRRRSRSFLRRSRIYGTEQDAG